MNNNLNIVPAHRSAQAKGWFALTAVAAVLWMAPPTAHAENECAPIGTSPGANGAAADTFACSGAYGLTGITYSSEGNLTVNSTGNMNVGTVGINLTGNGVDSVTFSATGTLTGTAGPVLDVRSAAGSVNVNAAGITGTNVNVTHGVMAESTGGGSVTVNASGAVNVTSTTAGAQQQSAITAVSTGGDGNVLVTTGGQVIGRLRGVEARASGTGTLTIRSTAGTIQAGSAGVAAIDAVTGSGLLNVDLVGGSITTSGAGLTGIKAVSGGDALIAVAAQRFISTSGNAIDLTAAGQATVNNNGAMAGRILFSGAGDLTFNHQAGAYWGTGNGSVMDGAVINNAGLIRFTSESRVGQLNLGLPSVAATNELVSLHGATYNGLVGSHLEMGVQFNGAGQMGCDTLVSGDCLDLRGGTTTGQTLLTVYHSTPSYASESLTAAGSSNAGIVLIDVGGGSTAADHFVLDPASPNYVADARYGGVIDIGALLDYTLLYNADTQQHVLATVPGTEAVQYGNFIHQALSTWHLTGDVVAGRQADLRRGATGKLWFRTMGEQMSRDGVATATIQGNSFSFDQKASGYTGVAMLGIDSSVGDNHVIGVNVGLVLSDTDYDDSSTKDKIDGMTAGIYGGWWQGGLTLDAAFNVNFLTLDRKLEALEASSTNVMSYGARIEGGWRAPLAGDAFYVQPLVTAAYVVSNIEDQRLSDNEISFDGAKSSRAAVGVRVGGDLGDEIKLGYWLVARAWNEFAADGSIAFANRDGGSLVIREDLGGSFQEYGLGVSVSNKENTLSGFLSAGAKTSNAVDSYNVSLGARINW